MRFGLYGKLPAKRDFVAVAASRAFLATWEPWLQGSISASRARLGAEWQSAFLRAPIWRFWLGEELAGGAMIGAFMPSVDGIGRYFPLTVFAQAESGDTLPPPELDVNQSWFEQAESLLLAALAQDATFDAVTARLADLPQPQSLAVGPSTAVRTRHGTLVINLGSAPLGEALADLRILDHARLYGGMSYWWTIGGEDFAPKLVATRRMPDPYLFTCLLTGRLDDGAS